MIHCIGDSHASVFSGQHKMQPMWPERSIDLILYFRSYRINAGTAYNLKNKHEYISSVIGLIQPDVDDKIMFCYGEVDIRAHLIKQTRIQNRSIKELTLECVNNYMEFLLFFNNKYENEILVWGPPASWCDEKPYPFHPVESPTYGTNLERNYVTRIFTEYLNDLCLKNKFTFLSIFEEMLNPDGTTNPYYIEDHIHLSQTALPIILEKFKEKTLI